MGDASAMTKKSKKLFLLIALVVLAVGVTALSGTFASGVDTSGTAEPVSSPFQVALTYYDYWSDDQGAKPLNVVFDENFPWCPGRTEILYLTLTNNEKFPVECIFTMNADENSALSNVFTYAVMNGLERTSASHPENWAAFTGSADLIQPETALKGEALPISTVTLAPGQSHRFALGLHMAESATSDYAAKQLPLTFSLRVNAENTPGFDPANP